MKLDEIGRYQRFEYENTCSCGKSFLILTQDHGGEYDTEIYLKCDCGEYVEFILPVN